MLNGTASRADLTASIDDAATGWRPKLLDTILGIFGALGLPVALNEFLYRDMIVAPLLLWAMLPALLLVRGRVRFEVRAALLLGTQVVLATWALATAGLMGSGLIFSALTVIVGGLLLGRGVGIGTFAIGLLTSTVVGYAAVTGAWTFDAPFDVVQNTSALWTSYVGSFALGVGPLLLAVLTVTETFEGLHARLRTQIEELAVREEGERRTAEHLRFVTDNVSDVLWSAGFDGRITYASNAIERLSGYTADEITALDLTALLTPTAIEQGRRTLNTELSRDGQPGVDPERAVRLRSELRTRSAEPLAVETNMQFLRGEDGRPNGLLGVTRDASERMRLEAAMASVISGTRPTTSPEDYFEALTRTLSQQLGAYAVALGVVEGDELRVLSVHLGGEHVAQVPLPITGSVFEAVLRDGRCVIEDDAAAHFPDAAFVRDAQIRALVAVPVLDALGARIGALIYFDRQPLVETQLTEELLTVFATHASLEYSRQRAVEEREQIRAQLLQSQKLESIGQLSGGIAHDFNNLLIVIQGNTELASSDLSDRTTVEESLQSIAAAADRAAALTRQLLSFSRRQVMDTRPTDLGMLLQGLAGMLRRLLPETMDCDIHAGDGLVIDADAGLIEQVIVNLAVNARDAMASSGRLSIAATRAPRSAAQGEAAVDGVLLTVSDTGEGMDEALRERIFEPFFTTKPEGAGTGLGLSVVLGIISQHGGTIELHSEPGRGSEFRIHLPAIDAEPAPAAVPPAPAALPQAPGDETILIVEDEPAVRRLAARLLSGAGYRVHEAVDGDDALRVFAEHAADIDLVLLDVVLPRQNGQAVREQILERAPGMPILFTSGYAADGIHTNFILEKGLTLLPKPYRGEELLEQVHSLLAPPAGAP